MTFDQISGLYESILVTEANTIETDYEASPLLFDEAFRQALLSKLAEVSFLTRQPPLPFLFFFFLLSILELSD